MKIRLKYIDSYFKILILQGVLILLFVGQETFAQEKQKSARIDSLSQVLLKTKIPLKKAQILNSLSESYKAISPYKSFEYANQALDLARNIPDLRQEACAYINIGEYYLDLGKYDLALEYFEKALKDAQKQKFKNIEAVSFNKIGVVYYLQNKYALCLEYQFKSLKLQDKTIKQEIRAQVLSLISYAYSKQGSYQKALDYHFQALKIREELGNQNEIAKSHNSIGDFYQQQQNYSEALKNYFISLRISQKINSKRGQAISLSNVGACYTHIGKLKEAKKYQLQAYKMKKELGIKKEIAISVRNIGTLFLEEKKLDSAMIYYQNAYEIETELQNKEGLILIEIQFARVLIAQKKYPEAISYLEEASKSAKKLNLTYLNKKAYKILYKTFAQINDAENFLKYYQYHDSLENISKGENLKKLNIEVLKQKYEYEKRQKAFELLKKQNEIKNLEIKQKNILAIVLVISIITAIVLIALLYNRNQVKYKTNQKLSKVNGEIYALNQKLINSEKKLQKSNTVKDKFLSIISHDLRAPFNSVISLLNMIGEDADSFSKEEQKDVFIKIRMQVKANLGLLDNLLEWSKSELDMVRFKPKMIYLDSFIKKILPLINNEIQKKKINFKTQIPAEILVYSDPNMLQTILFNLISNAIKFTKENENILLEVKALENDFIQITVKDSGVGMKEEEVNTLFTADHISKKGTSSEKGTGLGLLLCKEFIQTHRGSLKVESQKDKGSSFIFTLPSSEKVYQNAKP